jgi:4-amino-4-deoxy-L-arabinose transferase-like glycosyltransferase
MPRLSIFRSVLCGVAVYVLLLAGLNTVGLVGPDEPRYADVARGMYLSGDYITPRLFGEPWFEKPPLYYWLAALSFNLGISEFSARFPSALFALLFLGVWYWFAQRHYGESAARWSGLILATSVGWIGFARAAAMDMLLATTLGAALVFFLTWFFASPPGRPRWALYAFYASLALATLAKGPLAVALAGLVVVACILQTREWSVAWRMVLTPAVGVYALIALPWYVLCYARNGWPFIQEFFIRHNVQRFTSGEVIGHPQPMWFYIPVLPAAIFPWFPLLLIGIVALLTGGWRKASADLRIASLLYWVALPFLFFSLSANKLPGYLLPLLPPLSLLLAMTVSERNFDSRLLPELTFSPRWKRAALGLSALALLLVPLFSWILPESLATGVTKALARLNEDGLLAAISSSGVPLGIWLAAVTLIAAAIALAALGNLPEAGAAIGLGVCVCLAGLLLYMTPVINGIASVRNVAQRAVELGVDPLDLGTLYIHRTQSYGLGFYLGAGLREWNPDDPTQQFAFIAARDDFKIEEFRPGARPLASFPRQNLRLWELPWKQPAAAAMPASLQQPAK